MKTKRGTEFNVVGQIQVDNRPFNIVKLESALHVKEHIVRFIMLPATDFEFDRTDMAEEIVPTPEEPKEQLPDDISGT